MPTMRLEKQQWTIASLASGATSMVVLLLALSTKHWILMTETCSYRLENISMTFNFTLLTNVGLWQLCMDYSQREEIDCLDMGFIEMSVSNSDREKMWKTGSVIFATRIALPATISAAVFTVFGFLFSILGNFRRDKRIVIAAVMYISSGFCLSFSVILFISRINDELSLQPSADCYDFNYQYGWSFYLIGIAFVLEESSAVISIKLFLMQNSKKVDDMVRIIPGLENKLIKTVKYGKADLSQSQTLIW